MDGNGCPGAELLLRHVEHVAQRREDEERYRVENEDYAERHGHFILVGFENGADGGYRTAAANGRTRRNEVRRLAVDVQPVAQQHAECHDAYYRNYGEEHAFRAGAQGFLEVHVETKTYYSYLKQIFGCLLVEFGARIGQTEGEDQTHKKGQRCRNLWQSELREWKENERNNCDVNYFCHNTVGYDFHISNDARA